MMRKLMQIMESEMLDEAGAGPARIAQHIKDGEMFFMISAMRQNLSKQENEKRTQVLKNKLAAMPGCSFIETTGEYQEIGQEEPGVEKSFFVLPRSKNTGEMKFFDFAKKMMNIFDQDSILIGAGNKVSLITNDGETIALGSNLTFDPSVIKNLGGFSKIKGRKFSFADQGEAPTGIPYGMDSKKTA
jgi:hypothetical protein